MSRNLKSREGSVSKALFIVAKKDGNQRPVINLKQLNQFVPYQMEFTKRGIQVQVRFEGCLFLCSIKQKIQEICKISSVLYRTSTTGIHNIAENSCGFASLVKHTSKYIPGRYAGVWEDHGDSTNDLSKCDTYSPVSWLCDKSEQINSNYSSEIFGNDSKFH